MSPQHPYGTLMGANISPVQGLFKIIFPFTQAGYVSSVEGIIKNLS